MTNHLSGSMKFSFTSANFHFFLSKFYVGNSLFEKKNRKQLFMLGLRSCLHLSTVDDFY
jgi:hypothetical protein